MSQRVTHLIRVGLLDEPLENLRALFRLVLQAELGQAGWSWLTERLSEFHLLGCQGLQEVMCFQFMATRCRGTFCSWGVHELRHIIVIILEHKLTLVDFFLVVFFRALAHHLGRLLDLVFQASGFCCVQNRVVKMRLLLRTFAFLPFFEIFDTAYRVYGGAVRVSSPVYRT